ncbi:hypothetical protein B0A54_03513 [Friedmanniomyces endolithicus]|uniref:Uncharacterized protein n=1 Tax=Friedmanniomyces endolithicus TaxID=329885 RepID=A0A4U0VA82_9PEZI|nr:hypothetical protein B0A54_03513 [Friedmanniomyces endolithicus]
MGAPLIIGRFNGETRKMRARLQDHQVGHHLDPVELQQMPLRAPLVHLRVRQMQDQDLSAMHGEGMNLDRSYGADIAQRTV